MHGLEFVLVKMDMFICCSPSGMWLASERGDFSVFRQEMIRIIV